MSKLVCYVWSQGFLAEPCSAVDFDSNQMKTLFQNNQQVVSAQNNANGSKISKSIDETHLYQRDYFHCVDM